MEITDKTDIILENIKTRYSCRLFRNDPVPRKMIHLLMETANCAPSPMNTQPWEFVVLAGAPLMNYRMAVQEWLKTPDKRDKGSKRLLPEGGYFTTLPKNILNRKKEFLASLAEWVKKMGVTLKEVYPLTFYGHNAPVVIMVIGPAVLRDRHGLEIHQGLAAAIQNMLLSAHAIGLGSCWIGDIMRFGNRLRDHLKLGDAKEVVAAVCIGYPDTDSEVNKKRIPKRPVHVDYKGI